jgi:hypothetical protein
MDAYIAKKKLTKARMHFSLVEWNYRVQTTIAAAGWENQWKRGCVPSQYHQHPLKLTRRSWGVWFQALLLNSNKRIQRL